MRIYLIWYISTMLIYWVGHTRGIDLSKIYLTLGTLLMLICIILDKTMTGGQQTRANFFFDRYRHESSNSYKRLTGKIFTISIPLLIIPIISIIINAN